MSDSQMFAAVDSLTPENAGASALALAVARRLFKLDGLQPVREFMRQAGEDCREFLAESARIIDSELRAQK